VNRDQRNVTDLIESTIYDLRIDAAYLRVRSRDEANESDAQTLRDAADQINRLTSRLERTIRHS